MVYTNHKNGQEWGIVDGIAIPTLDDVQSLEIPRSDGSEKTELSHGINHPRFKADPSSRDKQ